jgi:hypothetical protein
MTIKVANGLGDLHAGIKTQRRIDGAMPKKLADNLVRTRIGLEEEAPRQMSELLCRHAHPHLGRDEIGDPLAKQGCTLVGIALARK